MPYYPPASGGALTIKDEGSTQGTADTMDFVGSAVAAAVVGSTATITVTGGVAVASNVASSNLALSSNTSLIVSEKYEINSGIDVDIAANAYLEIT